MEERRGESISETMKKVGSIDTGFLTKTEAIQAVQRGCDEHGIDSTLDPQERITRYVDIMRGSPHTKDELARKVSLENNDDRNKKREATEKHILSKIRSQDFKKLLESLNGKTQDQDYERILGLLGVIEKFGLKDVRVKKAYDNFLSPSYLSKVPEKDRQEIAVHEIRKVYMYVRDNLMKKG